MLKSATLLFAIVFLLCSCGAPVDEGKPNSKIGKLESKLESSTKIKFSCFDGEQCSDSFVLAINSSGQFPLYCTGFMADNKHMVVPANCLANASCKDVAAKTTTGDVHNCKQIQTPKNNFKESLTFNGKFSVVELDRPVRGNLRAISTSNMRDFNYYQLWYVKKEIGKSGYQLRHMRYNCRRTEDNVIFPSNNFDSSVVAMKNCNLRNESMGAVAVDIRNGDVLGLVHDAVSEDKTYRRFMHGRRGLTLTLATPINCILKSFDMETHSYDESLDYCDSPVYRPGSQGFARHLSSLFNFSSNRSVKHVFTRLSYDFITGRKQREFYALEYEKRPYQLPKVQVCRFSPYLNRNYEVYGGDYVMGCYNTDLEIVFQENQHQKSFSIYDDFGNQAIKVSYE